MLRTHRKTVLRIALLGLTLYLLLFSGFAVFHAYANDELFDTHGCQIGEWVSHGQAAFYGVVLVSAAVEHLHHYNPPIEIVNPKPFFSTASLRAPPYSLL